MLRLKRAREPRPIDVGSGVTLIVRPLTTAVYRAACHAAEADALAAARAEGVIEQAGGRVSDIPDISTRCGFLGLRDQFLLQALARAAVAGWSGVGDVEGGAAALTPAALDGLIRDYPLLAQRFEALYLADLREEIEEGEGCAAAPSGSLATAANTVDPATAHPAPSAQVA